MNAGHLYESTQRSTEASALFQPFKTLPGQSFSIGMFPF